MIALIVLAVLFALGYLALGNGVSHEPPFAVDAAIRDALRGHALALAVPLTQLGRLPAYVVVCAISLAFGIVRRAWFLRTVIAVVALAGAWKISDLCKEYFMRARPPGQLVFHESTFSYASGHATLALTFYGVWAIYAWRSDLAPPLRWTLVIAAALLILGIGWSRLALGAHYCTDVIGGYLLGATFLCILAAAMPSIAPEKQNPLGRHRNGFGGLASVFLVAIACIGCTSHATLDAARSSCPQRLALLDDARSYELVRNFTRASQSVERSVRVSFACGRARHAPLAKPDLAVAGHDLLRAGELAHEAGDTPRAIRLVREARSVLDVAVRAAPSDANWVRDAVGDDYDAEQNLERNEWPRFERASSTDLW